MSDPYKDAHYDHRYMSVLLLDGKEVACFRMCVHCNSHFLSVRGSGAKRGWCMRCNGITCGAAQCDPCIPFEIRLLAMEGKVSLDALPVSVTVPRDIQGG